MGLHHQIFILDAELEQPLNFENRKEITTQLIQELLERLDMKKLGPLEIYDAADAEYPGWSFVQPITTSHITGHYFEESNKPSHIHMDIYSCKEFDWEKIIFTLEYHLTLSRWSANLITREIDTKSRKSLIIEGVGRHKKRS